MYLDLKQSRNSFRLFFGSGHCSEEIGSMMSFSLALRTAANTVWQAQMDHPFVRGIGDGTLGTDRFAFWLEQDYIYLIEYCRVLAYAAVRAPGLESMTRFAALLQETITTEMSLHRSYVAEFGITETDLETAVMHPTTRGYTDFLLRTAATGDYAELLGALLPCMWGYSNLGQTLKRAGLPAEPRYARWIEMYASPEFADLAAWCRQELDRVCGQLPPSMAGRVEEAFLTSCRYELDFWEMAWSVDLTR